MRGLHTSVRPNRVKPNRTEPAEPAHLKPNRTGPNRTEPPLPNDVVSRLKAFKMVFFSDEQFVAIALL